ncbi:MAG: hypothetical protein L3J26_01420 [Candidatus Polarisedimenticolaceae bacterium]|nr:hypothetical protein [Candidatus Polarisedimenticolaceae bacterium]
MTNEQSSKRHLPAKNVTALLVQGTAGFNIKIKPITRGKSKIFILLSGNAHVKELEEDTLTQ